MHTGKVTGESTAFLSIPPRTLSDILYKVTRKCGWILNIYLCSTIEGSVQNHFHAVDMIFHVIVEEVEWTRGDQTVSICQNMNVDIYSGADDE
jgi:hypothetical protein